VSCAFFRAASLIVSCGGIVTLQVMLKSKNGTSITVKLRNRDSSKAAIESAVLKKHGSGCLE
jgi:hypothetical protein